MNNPEELNKKNRAFLLIVSIGVIATCALITVYKFQMEGKIMQPEPFIRNIDADQLHLLVNTSCKCIPIIDVRYPAEYMNGHLNRSMNVPYPDAGFLQHFENFNKSRTIVVYGSLGTQSWKACQELYDYGFLYLYNLQDGFISWEKNGYPIVKE